MRFSASICVVKTASTFLFLGIYVPLDILLPQCYFSVSSVFPFEVFLFRQTQSFFC